MYAAKLSVATYAIWYRYGLVVGKRIDGKLEAFWKYTPGTPPEHKITPFQPSRSVTFHIPFLFYCLVFSEVGFSDNVVRVG